jgi:hypothetical protein
VRISGHATASMLDRYDIADEQELRDAMVHFDAFSIATANSISAGSGRINVQ